MMQRHARNAAIVAAYLAQPDLSQREIGDVFGVSLDSVRRALVAADALDPARGATVLSRRHSEGRYRGRTGRKAVWPDCPPDLQREYHRLRKNGFPAAEARALLEPGGQA